MAPVWRWLLRRLLAVVPVVAAVAALTFVLIHLAPGDPVHLLAGDGAPPEYYEEMRARYGLDRPLAEQFVRYVGRLLTGDFGYSLLYQAPVTSVLLAHAPASALLALSSLLLALGAGFAAGLSCAISRSRAIDRLVRGAAAFAMAAPVFWTGELLILAFAVKLAVLPAGGMTTARESLAGAAQAVDVLRHLALPAVALALPFAAVIARVTRAAILDALHEPFARAGAARGLPHRRIVVRHAAPIALVPVVALAGERAAALVAGAAVTEALFGWPGIGHVVLHASIHRDYPLVVGTFIAVAAAVVVINAITDAVCARLDPRIRVT